MRYSCTLAAISLLAIITIAAVSPASAQVDDHYEENDNCPEATIIFEGSHELVVAPGDDDWYVLIVPGTSEIVVAAFFEHAQGDIDLYLLDSCDGVVLDQSESNNDDETVRGTNPAGTERSYRLLVRQHDGESSPYQLDLYYEPAVDSPTPLRPQAYLGNARPNPFNPSTTITYSIPQAQHVELNIYDPAGRLVRSLVSTHVTAGEHQIRWNGTDDTGRHVASGIYLYQLQAGHFVETKRMVLLK